MLLRVILKPSNPKFPDWSKFNTGSVAITY
jgi:hypothetical protein